VGAAHPPHLGIGSLAVHLRALMRILSLTTELPVVWKILDHLQRTGSKAARAAQRLDVASEALVW